MNGLPPSNEPRPAAPETSMDAGSQALSEALGSSFAIVRFVMVLLLLAFLGSGIFKVGPDERAIKLHLGKPVGEGESALLGPGLHWSLPYPIQEYVKVSISGIKKVSSTVGWYATTPQQEAAGAEPQPGTTLNPATDGYALTADNNIIHVRATLTYRIHDPIRYVFNFVNASNAIQNTLDNALVYAASRFNVDDVLTRDVYGFNKAVLKRVTELAEKQNFGITVEQCPVQTIPPRQLKVAFNSVVDAEQKRGKTLNEAHGYENQVLSKASAEAQSRINLAESDRVRLVAEVSSRADQFRDLLPKYRDNPSLFVQQRRTETLTRVLTNVQDKIFVPETPNGNSREMRYNFNRELPKPKAEESKP
jgi:membrane protease subunit HflK